MVYESVDEMVRASATHSRNARASSLRILHTSTSVASVDRRKSSATAEVIVSLSCFFISMQYLWSCRLMVWSACVHDSHSSMLYLRGGGHLSSNSSRSTKVGLYEPCAKW